MTAQIGLNSTPPPARGPALTPGNFRGLGVAVGVGVVSGVAAGIVLSKLGQPGPGVSVYSGTVLGLPCYPVTDPNLPVCIGISAVGGKLTFTNMDTGKIVTASIGVQSTYQAALPIGTWAVALTLLSRLSPIVTPQLVVSQGGQPVTQDFVWASGIA